MTPHAILFILAQSFVEASLAFLSKVEHLRSLMPLEHPSLCISIYQNCSCR